MSLPTASAYGRILSRPGALLFSSAGLMARFPMSMVGISTILSVQSLYGDYTAAGTVSAAYMVATAIGAPLLARLIDVHGQRRVMLPSMLVSAACLLGLIVAAQALAPLWLLVLLAAGAGGFGGSMGSLVRSRWTTVLSTPEDIHTAFSLEAALDEIAFMVGPVLATAVSTTSALPVTSGWIISLLLQVVGGLLFLSQRSTEPVPHPRARRPRRRSGDDATRRQEVDALLAARPTPVLRQGAVVSIIVIFLFSGAMFGANDVAAVAFATELGQRGSTGIALAAWATGSCVAALLYGSRSWGWPLWKQLVLGVVWLALGASTFVLAPGLEVLAVLYVLVGFGTAPTMAAGNNIVQATVARSQLTEGLAWVSTSMNIGVSLGSMVGGVVLDAAGSHGGYLFTASMSWVAVVAMVVGLPALRRARSATHLPGPAGPGSPSDGEAPDGERA
ncbi:MULTISPECIES: MFS transporter [unclassified Actinomyces]|uniref:MFS transporter n=1 Tax=unclassified Actinomyces TaxID=2609248 RepID=UPI0020181E17|nr:MULTISPECIES: MFS transporter [unclassified Actinomyces]MCL3777804.1 MFS transporter [Actinomyces sp. AC-20-1]MCL3790592.1 MFS transporter [Actinomyces sp. 187325]MCL3792911.1 MFS transporter [Actinomyces sp. 186855]MCL3795597.1 MFS transporter [Actinomyces sp. 217892]